MGRRISGAAKRALIAAALAWRPCAASASLSPRLESERLALERAAQDARGVERLTNENRGRFYELSFLKGSKNSSALPPTEAHELARLQVDADLAGGQGHLPEAEYARILELKFARGDDRSIPLPKDEARELAELYRGVKLDVVRRSPPPRDKLERIKALNRKRLRAPLRDEDQLIVEKTLQRAPVELPRAGAGAADPAEAAHLYDIDAPDSSVTFKVRHLVGAVLGRFGRFDGAFTYDKDRPGAWEAEANIQAASLDTADPWRDEHLRSPDFFDAGRCGTILLKSTGIGDVVGNTAKLRANLTIRCVTRPVVLDLVIGPSGPDAEGRDRIAVSARTAVNRRDFGMTWDKPVAGSVFVGDDVDISIEVQGVARAK